MSLPPIQTTLRDGSTAILRLVEAGDAEDLAVINRAVILAGHGTVRLPGDTSETVKEWHGRIGDWTTGERSGSNGCMLVAEIDGRVVGDSSIARQTPGRLRHVATLGVQVAPEAQGKGLGRRLMERALQWRETVEGAGLHRLDLFVRADNTRAIALYESLGFVVEARRADFIRDPDGSFVDDLIMVRILDSGHHP